MTSRAIMSNDINNVIANNSNISKKGESNIEKRDSFSKVLEKNNYENPDNHIEKHEKSDFHSSRPEVISNKNIKYVQNNEKENTQVKPGFVKEQFVSDIETTINDIANAYKETLDISDDELISIMEKLAINIFQLPMQELAKDIVLEANGENDITALLVNENALLDLQSMNQFFDKYDAQTKLDMPIEELGKLVEEAITNLVANKQEVLSSSNVEQQVVLDNVVADITSVSTPDNEISIDNNMKMHNVEGTNEVKLAETITLDNGKEISIEVVDVRDNMTKLADLDVVAKNLDSLNHSRKDMFRQENILSQESIFEQENTLDGIREITSIYSSEEQVQEPSLKDIHTKLESIVEEKVTDNKHQFINNTESHETKDIVNKNIVDKEFIGKNINDKNIAYKHIIEKELPRQDYEAKDVQSVTIDVDNTQLVDSVEVDDTFTSKLDKGDNVDIDIEALNEKLFDKTVKEIDNDSNNDSFENSSERDFSNDGSNETFYDKFITNLEKSFGLEEGDLLKEVSHIKEMQEIVNQVVDKIKIHINKETTTMKLNLNPEHLGKVELEVTSKSGILTADFVVENETAKEALEKGLPALIEKFHEQGLKVEAIEVSIADYDFTRQDGERKSKADYGQDDKKKKRNGKISLDDMTVTNETVQEEKQIMSNMGIDYSI